MLVSLCSLYLNPLSDVGKQSLYVRGVPKSQGGRRVKVLASVTEGTDISEDWHPILSVIRKNASSWDRQRVKEQLKVNAAMLLNDESPAPLQNKSPAPLWTCDVFSGIS